MWIRAADVKEDDVISVDKEDCTVLKIEKYRKQGRKWVTITVTHRRLLAGTDYVDQKDIAVPADVMLPWHGTALF